MNRRPSFFAQPNQFPGVVVLVQGGTIPFERGSIIDFDPATDLVSIKTAGFVEATASRPASHGFDEIARFKLAPGMLVCLEKVPEPQQHASIGRRSVLIDGHWYQLDGEPEQVENRMDVIKLVGRRGNGLPGWPEKQALFLFRLTDGVVYSWSS